MDFQNKDPEDIFNEIKGKFKMPQNKPFFLPLVLAFFFFLIVLRGANLSPSPVYTIQPDEMGVVLRFGKFVGTTDPGLNFKIPLIERAIPVKVEKVYTEEFGFRTQKAGVRSTYNQRSYDTESLMLAGDLNILDVEWMVQFKINDPYKVLFNIRDVNKSIRDISEAVMRSMVGDYSFNEVLTTKRMEINIRMQEEMQRILNEYEAGIQIITVKFQDVNPPDPVKPAFNEVNQAEQEKEKLINQAWEMYNQKIPQAKGEALKMIKEAEGYALEKINRAEGDAERFTLLQQEYARAKEVTQKRLYLEAMNGVLKRAGTKYIVDPKEKGILPLLQLSK
jgi:modulator of FtsH protease HflK